MVAPDGFEERLRAMLDGKPYLLAPVLILAALALSVGSWRWLLGVLGLKGEQEMTNTSSPSIEEKIPATQDEPETLSAIDPVPADFDWRTTEPIQLRPFKPKYHLTMAIENNHLNNLVNMDKTYTSRLAARRQIMLDHEKTVFGCLPGAEPALNELYTFLTSTYLPTRYPSMFHLDTSAGLLHNLVTGTPLPLAPPADPKETLTLLTVNIDQDYLILLPSDDGDGYTLKAMTWCYPAGFDPEEKIGRKLRDIHIPVPKYKQALEKSMDRYFARIEVGKFVTRANWSIDTKGDLYTIGNHHVLEGEEPEKEDIDISNTFSRSELQNLFRLPKTRALIFAFELYMYPLQQIKDEGSGPLLADAIDGLTKGNVPDMFRYKRAIVWGEKVTKFLRS